MTQTNVLLDTTHALNWPVITRVSNYAQKQRSGANEVTGKENTTTTLFHILLF